tara:strand:+ start:128 stop:322 length:195 start_codon:yes stop_codon:yes gene_type:complete
MSNHDHSKILIKVLNNFYDKHNIEESERCDAETFIYYLDDDKANAWLERYCEVWDETIARRFKK